MLQVALRIIGQALAIAVRWSLFNWRITLPAFIGGLGGYFWSTWLAGFGIDKDFTEPLGLPRAMFKIVFVLLFAIGLAVMGRRKLNDWFPPNNTTGAERR
jgi:hypothetical protein